MNRRAYELVGKVFRAQDIAQSLPQYPHKGECPKLNLSQMHQKCTCGADQDNRQIDELRNLLNLQFIIDFARD